MMQPPDRLVEALRVMNALASSPTVTLEATQLAEMLGREQDLVAQVLAALSAESYVRHDSVRDAYTLGGALIAIGEVAVASNPAVGAAGPEVDELARELDCECMASIATTDEILFVRAAGMIQSHGMSIQVGTRLEYRPPTGLAFVAWSDEATQQRWMARGAGSGISETEHARAFEFVRLHGVVVGAESTEKNRSIIPVHASSGDSANDQREAMFAQLAREYLAVNSGSDYDYVLSISAPVFDDLGRVVLALTLQGFREPLTRDASVAVVARLMSGAQNLQAQSQGS